MSGVRKYNYLYDRLVDGSDDIYGIVTYSIYKRQKIEFINKRTEKKGSQLTETEIEEFSQISNSESQIKFYKTEAEYLLNEFVNQSASDEINKYKDELDEEYTSKLRKEISGLKCSFWSGVFQSTVGSLTFVLALGLLIFILWSARQGTERVVEEIFDVQIIHNNG